jgi:ADP-ribose pyrophosphatase
LCAKFANVKTLKSKIAFEKHGRKVVVDTLECADGSKCEWVYFGDTKAKDNPTAVAVAAFTKDDKMLLVKEYRHPLGKLIYDLPAGSIREGETPQQAILRELEEETGYTAENLTWIGRFNWAPSNIAGVAEIFFTKDLRMKGKFHADEIVDIEFMDFSTVLEKILKGQFIDSTLIIAALIVNAKNLLQNATQ